MHTLFSPIDPERRAGLAILVAMRWLLIGAALFAMTYRPGTGAVAFPGILLLIAIDLWMNVLLQRRLTSGRTIFTVLPLVAAVYDAVAITVAVGLADGFANDSFVLYYPALLGFSLVFRGRWSVVYAAALLLAYTLISLFTHGNFHYGDTSDQKILVLRLATMAATVATANMVVRIERGRREQAVAAEAMRAREVLDLEQRARAAERAALDERRRLAQDVHDGISQSVYMLTLGLETAAAVQVREPDGPRNAERMDGLVRLAKQTLLDTRNLLFDLERVMAGQTSLAALVRNQAREFAAVTGIPVEVEVTGEERPLPPRTTGEVYRVVQEGLANVYKHAGAPAATLRLAYDPECMRLELADTGRGFDTSATLDRGYGLRGMRDRIERLRGDFAIASCPGQGTRLTVCIPYAEEGHDGDPGAAG
jgi:signal transduction histidine kinase